MSDIKRIVEKMCCDFTYGSLLECVKPYIKGIRRFEKNSPKRSDLEDAYYAVVVLNLMQSGIYEIHLTDGIEERCDGKIYTVQQVLEYIHKKTIFTWYDEMEFPITRDMFQYKVIIKLIGQKLFIDNK